MSSQAYGLDMATTVQQALHDLSKEVIELDIGAAVPQLIHPIDPLDFYRSHVGPNKPAVIQGAMKDWPAMHRWQSCYLRDKLQGKELTVAMTPNGRADAIVQLMDGAECFALPHEEKMSFDAFLALLADKHASKVVYAQAQNDSLRQEFASLLPDIDADLAWAAKTFGQLPDAVNLWIGDSRSVTTFHRDFYENVYCVVSGSKTFTLLPPCDSYRLHKRRVPIARYAVDEKTGWSLQRQEPEQHVCWCPIDREIINDATAGASTLHKLYPRFFETDLPPPLKVTLHPGDILYLPCMWHHMVEQEEGRDELVIAVNFWFEQHYGSHYAATMFTDKVADTVLR